MESAERKDKPSVGLAAAVLKTEGLEIDVWVRAPLLPPVT